MKPKEFKCIACGWRGKNVEYESVETCTGDDLTEVCPECGSMNVVPDFNIET